MNTSPIALRLQRVRCMRYERRIRWSSSAANDKKSPAYLAARRIKSPFAGFRPLVTTQAPFLLCYAAGAFDVRLRELRWKNSAWLATADTIAGWNGFEIRNAGSGRSPVRKRSG